jgi:spermidine dehydrogenase
VLVLDQHPIFGGEAKQNEFDVDGYHLTAPQGSTGIVVPFSTAKNANFYSHFCSDLGFPDEFVFQEPTGLSSQIKVPHDAWFPMHLGWEKADAGFYYEGKGWVKNPWRNGFAMRRSQAPRRRFSNGTSIARRPNAPTGCSGSTR